MSPHGTDNFRTESTIDTWAEVSASCQWSHRRRIPVGLDTYSMVDLVSISFVQSLGMTPCSKPKHQHVAPPLEGVGRSHPKTYGFYHLRMTITDRYNRSFDFVRPFLAVDRNPEDSQVLLGRPALKDFKINICNGDDSWEFEFQRKPKISILTPHQFAKELTSKAQVFEVKAMFNPKDENIEIDKQADVINLDNIPERIYLKHKKFFDKSKKVTSPETK